MFLTIYDQLHVVFRACNQIYHAVDLGAVLSSSAGAGSYDDPSSCAAAGAALEGSS